MRETKEPHQNHAQFEKTCNFIMCAVLYEKTEGPTAASDEEVNEHEVTNFQQNAPDGVVRFEGDGMGKQILPMPITVWPGPTTGPSLTESFGYSQCSTRNVLALLQQLGLGENNSSVNLEPSITSEVVDEIRHAFEILPDRRILDFLVQFFVAEIAWMDQLVYIPWFLAKYRAHPMTVEALKGVTEIDFTLLVLRICSYALQFLPSPAYPLDRYRGVLLSDVQQACDKILEKLHSVRSTIDSRGTLLTVLQLSFLGLKCQAEGKMDKFWETAGQATRVALRLCIHSDAMLPQEGMTPAEQTLMARWVFCNLFIWDGQMLRQLDCIPAIPDQLSPSKALKHHRPGSRRGSTDGSGDNQEDIINIDNSTNSPDPFAERLQQARLASFWRGVSPQIGAEYDVVEAEERYSKFCSEFLPGLPPSLALVNPDKTWDQVRPEFALQRQLLHMSIFDWICWNLRPILLWRPTNLPAYKAVLVLSQKKALGAAALQALDSVSQLHTLLGNRHTRLPAIVVTTFEATVVLLTLLMDPIYPEPCVHTEPKPQPQQQVSSQPQISSNNDPLQSALRRVTRQTCFLAVQTGLSRLQMLAEVSSMADHAAETIVQLMNKVSEILGDACPRNREKDRQNKRNRQEYENVDIAVTSIPLSSAQDHAMILATASTEMTNWLSEWSDSSGYMQDNGTDTVAVGGVGTASWPSIDTPSNMLSEQADYLTDNVFYYNNGGSNGNGNKI